MLSGDKEAKRRDEKRIEKEKSTLINRVA